MGQNRMRVKIRDEIVETLEEEFASFPVNRPKIYKDIISPNAEGDFPFILVASNGKRLKERMIQSILWDYSFVIVLVNFKNSFTEAENQLELLEESITKVILTNHYLHGLADNNTNESVYMLTIEGVDYKFGNYQDGYEATAGFELTVSTERKGPF